MLSEILVFSNLILYVKEKYNTFCIKKCTNTIYLCKSTIETILYKKMYKQRNQKLPKTFFFYTSILAIISAYILEYVFGFSPCKLCFYQRIIYCISIVLSAIYIFKPIKITSSLLITSYLANMFVAGYQVGVEQHWITNIISCTTSAPLELLSDQEILELTMSSHGASCEIPQFVFLGISLAGLNFLYCAAVMTLYLYYNKKNEISA